MSQPELPVHETSVNPYAAPTTEVFQAAVPTEGGIWRCGDHLIMHRAAVLPDICVKSNEPTGGYRLKRKLSWHHKAVFIAVISPLIYMILALALSKRATIEIGMSDHWRAIRRRRMWLTAIVMLGGLGLFFGAFFVESQFPPPSPVVPLMIFGGMLVGFVGLLFGAISTRMVKPTKIDDHYIYLKGFHPEYLDRYPLINLPG